MQHKDKVDILRISATTNAFGIREVKNVLHNNLPCTIQWKRGAQKIYFDKQTYFRDAMLYCKVVDITTKDRVKYNGKTYDIIDVENVDNLNRQLVLTLKLVE